MKEGALLSLASALGLTVGVFLAFVIFDARPEKLAAPPSDEEQYSALRLRGVIETLHGKSNLTARVKNPYDAQDPLLLNLSITPETALVHYRPDKQVDVSDLTPGTQISFGIPRKAGPLEAIFISIASTDE